MYLSVLKLKSKRTYKFANVIKAIKKSEETDIAIKLGNHIVEKKNIDRAEYTMEEISSDQWQIVVPDTKLLDKFENGKKLKPEEMETKLLYLKEKHRKLELSNCMDSDMCTYMNRYTDENGWMTCPDHCKVRQQKVEIKDECMRLVAKLHPDYSEDKVKAIVLSRYL